MYETDQTTHNERIILDRQTHGQELEELALIKHKENNIHEHHNLKSTDLIKAVSKFHTTH